MLAVANEGVFQPVDIKFGRKRGDSLQAAEQLVAINLSRALILLNLQDTTNPVELTFQAVRSSMQTPELVEANDLYVLI